MSTAGPSSRQAEALPPLRPELLKTLSMSINRYFEPNTLDPYWASGSWSPSNAERSLHLHRLGGGVGVRMLELTDLITLSDTGVVPAAAAGGAGGAGGLAGGEGGGGGGGGEAEIVRVLDPACGTGVMGAYIQELSVTAGGKKVEVVFLGGVDEEIAETSRKAQVGGYVNPRFVKGDLTTDNFPDDTFDVVILNFAIFSTLDEDQQLTEIRRILKPGGLVAYTSPIYFFTLDLIEAGLATLPNPRPYPANLAFFETNKPGPARRLLERNGFEVKVVEEVEWDAPFDKASAQVSPGAGAGAEGGGGEGGGGEGGGGEGGGGEGGGEGEGGERDDIDSTAKIAAEATAPMMMYYLTGAPLELKGQVMRSVRDIAGERLRRGELDFRNKVLLAVGRKPPSERSERGPSPNERSE